MESIIQRGSERINHEIINNRPKFMLTNVTFQADILRVFQLNDFVKSSIYIIQTKDFKILIVLMRLEQQKNIYYELMVTYKAGFL